MSQNMPVGNMIQPLRNVAALVKLTKELQSRELGLPGMAVFYGFPGYGKTYAAIHCGTALDAIHISVQELWTRRTLLTQILRELNAEPVKGLAEMLMQVNELLTIADRPLIIDEADYAVQRNLIKTIRDIHDGSEVPVILIGMEKLPQKLRQWELVDSRIYDYVAAEPATLEDTEYLSAVYARGVTIADDLLDFIVTETHGKHRRIATCLAHVKRECTVLGDSKINRAEWGNRPFPQNKAPTPRPDLD